MILSKLFYVFLFIIFISNYGIFGQQNGFLECEKPFRNNKRETEICKPYHNGCFVKHYRNGRSQQQVIEAGCAFLDGSKRINPNGCMYNGFRGLRGVWECYCTTSRCNSYYK